MPTYQYIARAHDGRVVSGTADASDQNTVVQMLREKGLMPTRISIGSKSTKKRRRGRGGRTNLDDLVVFSNQMSVMIRAGLPLIEVLDILAEQTERNSLAAVIRQIQRDVEGGESLTEAMVKHANIFSMFYLSMIRAGEASGMLDSIKLKLPVFGPLFLKSAVANFTRTLGTLIRSGVNILYALEICAKTAGNARIESAVLRTKTSIQSGESLAKPLTDSAVFPPMVTRMIDVGEKTGALESMLTKIADFYEDQVNTAVAGLTSLIEPLLIVFLGVVVGFIVISMFMPMFKMIELIK
jgi:type II secretory pathway component PulF